jgi:hypothetical protein
MLAMLMLMKSFSTAIDFGNVNVYEIDVVWRVSVGRGSGNGGVTHGLILRC